MVFPFFGETLAFAHPEWLRALFLVPVLLVLWFLRRRPEERLVPWLPLWDRVFAERRARSGWIRRLLSFLIAAVTLGLGIAIVAGPYFARSQRGRGDTILVLDGRYPTRALSSDGRPLFEHVREEAWALAQTAIQDGGVSLGILREHLEVLSPPSDTLVETEALADAGAPRGFGSLDALIEARTLWPSSSRVLWVTAHSPSESEMVALGDARILVAGAGNPAPQAGIMEVTQSGDLELTVRVAGSVENRTLVVRDESGPVCKPRPLREDPTGSVKIALDRVPGTLAEVVLEPRDGFVEDDRVPLVWPVASRSRVLIVASATTPALDAFLASVAGEDVDIAASGRTEANAWRELAANYDLVILVNQTEALPLPAGNYLLLGSRAVDLPLEFAGEEFRPAEITEVESTDPLVRALDLSGIRIERALTTRGDTGVEVLIRSSLGPLLVRGTSGPRRFLSLSLDISTAHTNLALLPALPLILRAALRELAQPPGDEGILVHRIDSPLPLRAGEKGGWLGSGDSTTPLERDETAETWRLPWKVGHFTVPREGPARRLAVAWLDHPARPTAQSPKAVILPPFPSGESRESARLPFVASLAILLILGWILFHRDAID